MFWIKDNIGKVESLKICFKFFQIHLVYNFLFQKLNDIHTYLMHDI